MIPICMQEWSEVNPKNNEALKGFNFNEDQQSRAFAESLTSMGKIEIQELAQGLRICSKSYVGVVNLGNIKVTIQPKLNGLPLFHLLKYAYGLRNLALYDKTLTETTDTPFHELLILQLDAEATELISRGIKRDYIEHNEHLSSPKGRFNFTEMVLEGGLTTASLPCRYVKRSEDCLHNQLLLAGLKLGVKLTADIQLRSRLRRKASILEDNVSSLPLNWYLINKTERYSNRLTRAYDASLEIIKLLFTCQGSSLETNNIRIATSGFLVDMNMFFQRLLTRFFNEWLEGYQIEDEKVIKGMINYIPGYNPRNLRAPNIRPDIVISDGYKTQAILDAKYRDLWENPLPREMLYQLAVYSLIDDKKQEATILYPSMDNLSKEAKLEIRDTYGTHKGNVVLRPVHMEKLVELVSAKDSMSIRREMTSYANYLAFGK